MVLLLSVLVIVIAVYAVILSVSNRGDGEGASGSTGEGVYIDRNASEVASLTYRTGGSEFSVVKSGSVYALGADESFPLDMTAVNFMTHAAAKLTYDRRINPEGNDLGEYGLTEPQAVIDIVYTDGARLTLKVGNYNVYSEAYYCTTGDGFVYLFGGSFTEAFTYSYSDLLLDDGADTPQEGLISVYEIEITCGEKRVTFSIDREDENAFWKKNGGEENVYDDVKSIYNDLYMLSVDEWVAYNLETEEEFDVYGLSKPDIRVVFKHIETEEIENEGSATVTKEYERQTAFLIGPPTDEEDENAIKRYFAFGGGSIVYVVEESEFSSILEALE